MAVQVLKAGAIFRGGLEPEVDCPGALSAVWYSWQLHPAGVCLHSMPHHASNAMCTVRNSSKLVIGFCIHNRRYDQPVL